MNHGSLFSGIGGFDLAAQWMGWNNIFHCEINSFGKRVLKYYWPEAIGYDDITKTDFTIHRGQIDILTGGFPCQPYSSAGKRKGTEDDRHLWPEMLRAIREIQPHYIVGENVRGLTNWNGGMVFDEVQSDLEAEGYQVTPFMVPACAVGAPHRRDRIWFIANGQCNGSLRAQKFKKDNFRGVQEGLEEGYELDSLHDHGIDTNTASTGLQRRCNSRVLRDQRKVGNKRFTVMGVISKENWQNFPTQSPVCGRDDGLPAELDGITFSKWRQESIKGYGNAIVPQVAYEFFKVIEYMIKFDSTTDHLPTNHEEDFIQE